MVARPDVPAAVRRHGPDGRAPGRLPWGSGAGRPARDSGTRAGGQQPQRRAGVETGASHSRSSSSSASQTVTEAPAMSSEVT